MTPQVIRALAGAGVSLTGDEVQAGWALARRATEPRRWPSEAARERAMQLALALMVGNVSRAETLAVEMLDGDGDCDGMVAAERAAS